MKFYVAPWLALGLCIGLSSGVDAAAKPAPQLGLPPDVAAAMQGIDAERIRAHVRFLADDLLEGASIDAAAVLREGSLEVPAGGGLVVVRDLAVTTMCPHHLLPAFGTGLVAYVPSHRVAGIGTLAHVVDALSRRLTLQERIGADVVAANRRSPQYLQTFVEKDIKMWAEIIKKAGITPE